MNNDVLTGSTNAFLARLSISCRREQHKNSDVWGCCYYSRFSM